MKQSTQAEAIQLEYKLLNHRLGALHDRLYRLLEKAQNPPPYGSADGTLTGPEYNALRAIERRTLDLIYAITAKPTHVPKSIDDADELP